MNENQWIQKRGVHNLDLEPWLRHLKNPIKPCLQVSTQMRRMCLKLKIWLKIMFPYLQSATIKIVDPDLECLTIRAIGLDLESPTTWTVMEESHINATIISTPQIGAHSRLLRTYSKHESNPISNPRMKLNTQSNNIVPRNQGDLWMKDHKNWVTA